MRKKFLARRIFTAAGILVLALGIAFWILASFFLDDALTNTGIPKLQKIVRIETMGRYEISISHITHSDGDIFCYNCELVRNHFDTSERGITIERIVIDTLRCMNVGWWNLLWGNSLSMSAMVINRPKIYFVDAAKVKHMPDTLKDTINVPPLSITKATINDILVYLPNERKTPSFRGLDVHLEDFYLDPQHPQNQSLLFSKHIDFQLPRADYSANDPFYMMHIRNMKGNSSDSSLLIDSFAYMPRMNEDEFAAKHKYATAAFQCKLAKIRIQGIDLNKFVSGEVFELRKFSVGSWYLDSYLDRTRPANPSPPAASMPNDLLHSLPWAVNIELIDFTNGYLRLRERSATSHETGILFFDRVNISISPVSTMDSKKTRPSVLNASAYFVGEGFLRTTWIYPLWHKSFDMDAHATVTGFDAKRINTWLVPFERTEVSGGALDSGRIDMKIRNGVNTTTVIPYYHGFSMKVLNADPSKGRGIMEGVKTFIAKTFVVRGDNPKDGQPVVSATTARSRARDEELMQFIWLSLRKSLGTVIGGFQ